MTAPASLLTMTGPSALRMLARAFEHFHEFDRFVTGLQSALDQSEDFNRLSIQIDRTLADAPVQFLPGSLTLPLGSGAGQRGTLQIAPDGPCRQFGPEDLHLMGGLADFLAAVLDQAVRMQDAQRSRELLRFLLNQAPIGLAAYTPERRLLVANDLAMLWLGEAGPPFLEIEAGAENFYLRAGGKLIYGEARRAPDGVWVFALHDLTPGQVRLMESLQRETFRGLVEQHAVSFALVESPQVREGVLRQLPALRQALANNEIAGPYDATRIGIVLSGTGGAACRSRLRNWQEVFADTGALRVGFAELRRDGVAADALLGAALRHSAPYGEIVRPSVLVHDGDAGVIEAIGLMLGQDYRLSKSTELEHTREHLRREEFDVLVIDLDLRGAVSGAALAREARAVQPAIKPLFTSVNQPPYELPPELAAEGAVVLQKPFRPDEFRQAVRNRLGT
jgi:CheY-like chemotaxis protein